MKKKVLSFKSLALRFGRFFSLRLKNHDDLEPHHLNPSAPLRTGLKLNDRGWTLVELMLVTAMIGLITPAMTRLFVVVSQGFAADEMHTQLKTGNQNTLNRIHVRIGASKHFFMGDTSGVSFLSAVSILSTAPTTLAGTTLAQPQTSVTGAFSYAVTDFEPTFIGNALLFGAYDAPETFTQSGSTPVSYQNSPMTLTGVLDSAGTSRTIIIDMYRFYYYYLTSQISKPIAGATCAGLVEWQSIRYADAFEIEDFYVDNTFQSNLCHAIATNGVTAAWDPSQTDPNNAFVTFGTSGAVAFTPGLGIASFKIMQEPMGGTRVLTKVSSGMLSSGFGYGVCPNTRYWQDAPIKVPLYAPTPSVATSKFPSGFEIGVSGVATGRKILVRSALVAKGAAPKVVYNDISMVNDIQDQW